MARGRFVSASIALDPELNRATPEAQLLYLRCIPHLDRDGLILGQPAALWARVAPLMESMLPAMPRLLDELVSLNLVVRYDTRIGSVLFFKGFHKNQQGMRYDREGPSEYECPPGMERTPHGLAPVRPPTSGTAPPPTESTPDLLRSDSGLTPPEVEVEVEVQVEDQVRTITRAGACAHEEPPPPLVFLEPPPEEEEPDRHARREIAEAMHRTGVTLSGFMVEQYDALVAEVGLVAAVAGLEAAAKNGKAHKFSYVQACARNKAQGISIPDRVVVTPINGRPQIVNTHQWDNYEGPSELSTELPNF